MSADDVPKWKGRHLTERGAVCRAIRIDNSVGELANPVAHHVQSAAEIADLSLSGDETMLAEIRMRRSNDNEPLPDLEYWSTDDFVPVQTEIDRFVRRIGWIR